MALSAGVLLLGYSAIAPIGWLRKVAPSAVAIQPSEAPSGSMYRTGTPEYSTTVVNAPSTGVSGVTTSLCLIAPASSTFSNAASSPLTVTESIVIVG